MLQILAALGLAIALALSSHVRPMDGSGGPPNTSMATPAPLTATPPPPDGSGGPPNK